MEKKVTRWVLSILVMAMIIAGLMSTTYALFSVDLYAPNQDVYSTGMLAITAKSKTDTISLTNALPMTDEKGVTTNPYVFTIKNIGNLDYLFDVKLLSTGDSATSFSPQYIKLKIDDGEVITLSSLINSEIKSDIVLPAGESIDISLRVWLSSDTPNSEMGKGFNSKIVTSGQAVYTSSNGEFIEKITLISKIYSLYNNAVENNAVLTTDNGATDDVVTYNYAPIYDNDTDSNTTGGLINDRLGGTTSDYNAGNIRYYGANPSNYIYFNCDTYPDTNCELWRIIGVFKDIKLADGSTKDLIKIAHSNVSSTTAQWDDNSNDWHNAILQSSLNTTYYNGTVFNGLKGITASTQNKIEEVVWNLGGYDSSSGVYPNKLYEYERGDAKCSSCTYDTTWPGKIALMYPSDYGYATDLSVCKKEPYNYDTDTNCKGKDWLIKSDSTHWLLTSGSGYSGDVWIVNSTGCVSNGSNVNDSFAVRPVLYLDSEQIIESGSGTIGDPYRLSA